MLVVTACDEFSRGEFENWPWSDRVAYLVAGFARWLQDLAVLGGLQAKFGRELIPEDQQSFHPQRMMPEDAEEDVDNTCLRLRELCPIRVIEVRCIDDTLANGAGFGYFARLQSKASMSLVIIRAQYFL